MRAVVTMPDKKGQYKSIEEVRSSLYPGSASMLNLEREDVIELPISLAGNKSLRVIEEIAKRAAESEIESSDS